MAENQIENEALDTAAASVKDDSVSENTAINTEPVETVSQDETDEALSSFLNREQTSEKAPKKKVKPLLLIIIGLAVVAALVVTLILINSQKPTYDESSFTEAEIELSVGEDGMHEAKVGTDENGNILENGSGALLSYVPADIKEINVENTDGSFAVKSNTPEGEATVYTLVGFEGFDMQSGIADEVANTCADLHFTEIISAEGELKDFGLDDPRATVTVNYSDDTRAVIRVGSEAASELGVYIAFGSSDAVYLVGADDVKPFLYSVNDFISLAITDNNENSDNAEFSTLTITGTHYDEPITLEPNKDEAIDAAYLVTAPKKMVANATESYDIAGSVRGLQAESVVCANPSDNQLESYGLSDPYATVKASYPDTDITLHACAPNDSGLVYVYNPDKNVVYNIQLAAVSWANTSLDLLIPEYITQIKLAAVSKIEFKASDSAYTFDVSSTTESITDDSGTEQQVTTTTASYNGEELKEDNFNIFFQNLNGIKNQGAVDGSGDEVMEFTVSYSTGRDPDAVKVYKAENAAYAVELNGEKIGSASKTYIDQLIKSADSLAKGESVTSI